MRPLPLLLAFGLALPACGKKGDPQPPLRRLPQGLSALSVAQRGARVVVSFTAPRAYSDGTRLPVVEVELLRAERAGDFAQVARAARRRAAPGESLSESEPLPAPGTVLRFAARVRAKGKPSPLSRIVSLTVHAPPDAPNNLSARRTKAGVLLDWAAPDLELVPGPPTSPQPSPPAAEPPAEAEASASPRPEPPAAPLDPAAPTPSPSAPDPATPRAAPSAPAAAGGYWVYRRSAAARYGAPLSAAPLAAPPYEDTDAARETVCYVVRTVLATDPIIESADSNEVCIPPEMPASASSPEPGLR